MMGRNLDPLERRGLVKLEIGGSDQRERVAHLTKAGKAAIRLALPHWRKAQARIGFLLDHAAMATLAQQVSELYKG